MDKKIIIALIFGFFGITIEIFFTAISDLFQKIRNKEKHDFSLEGKSYIWMFFIYSLIPILFDFGYPMVKDFNIFLRVFIYGIIILIVEFITGFLLEFFTGECPWKYTKGINLLGYVRIDYIFFWMFFGFIIEKIYLILNNQIVDVTNIIN